MDLDEEEAMISYQECVKSKDSKEWEKAINEEKESLEKNKTWELIDEKYAQGKQILTSRWVFKIKEDGRYRARLVARGCQQHKNSLDFKETYSCVVNAPSLRIILALAAMKNLNFLTFDIKSAFLNGDLHEEIFMKLPEGFNHPRKVCLLKKALYGLRQAPLQWFKKLSDFLKKEGFTQLKSDKCVFKNPRTMKTLYIAIHVDDGLIVGEDIQEIKSLMKKMQEKFEVAINENPKLYLGMEIKKDDDQYTLSQMKYCQDTVMKYLPCMKDCKIKDTPIAKEKNSQQDTKEESEKDFPYRQIVGSLLYASSKTRPDISFAVGYESRTMENPSTEEITNVKRTIRYLKGTPQLGIRYYKKNKEDEEILHVYCDADHAGDKRDSKSTTGFVMMYGNGPVQWCAKKQKTVARSSAEAEYVAAATCCAQMKYIKTFLEELNNKTK